MFFTEILPVLDDSNDDLITDELATRHHILGLEPDRGLGRNGSSKHVTGRKLGNLVS